MLHYFQNVVAKIKGLLFSYALLLLWTNNKVEQDRTQITLWILDRIFRSVAPIYWRIWMSFLVMFCSQWIEQTKNRACCSISLYCEFFSLWSSRSRIADFLLTSTYIKVLHYSFRVRNFFLVYWDLRTIFFLRKLCTLRSLLYRNVCRFRVIKVGNVIFF